MGTAEARLRSDWEGSAWQHESTIHQLSPYLGKTKSSMAASLIAQFTDAGDTIYDPFSGSGTFALEAWRAGRHVIANDLSPYAFLLTSAKLRPYHSYACAIRDIDLLAPDASAEQERVDLRQTPKWVRGFFHPDTLRETIAWATVLKANRRWFLLACLLGILHHQRPGFLSFPSSHTVPYLRERKFPRSRFPSLYEYRAVRTRLEAKVKRSFRRVPDLNFGLTRRCLMRDAETFVLRQQVDAILTSPPYMRQLDYGRDNRLRLWFLGCNDWASLDKLVTPGQDEFLELMAHCFTRWKCTLKSGAYCVLVIGDTCTRENRDDLSYEVARIATQQVGGYSLAAHYTEIVRNDRRLTTRATFNNPETVLVLRATWSSRADKRGFEGRR